MSFRLQVRNYRGLRAVDWSPEGVCALVGANGSGKTTLLDVPALLGDALDHGLARALEAHGGMANARNMYADESEPYFFEVTLYGETWRLAPVLAENGFRPEETLASSDGVVISRKAGADYARIEDKDLPVQDGLALMVYQNETFGGLPLVRLLSRYRLYGSYNLAALRRSGSPDSSKRQLDERGTNVFSVLRNWRDKRQDRVRYEFVIDGLREIFFDFFDDLDFEKAAQVVGADLHLKRNRVHSASLAPDGWFVALLHLTALASTDEGDLIAIDEPENALHPRAIKLLLERMRDWSRRHSVTVLLATHSPVIISDFDTRPEQLFVMQQDQPVCPVAVTDLKERDWLAHFALGDLYMREEFGAPPGDAEHRPHHDG
ncbi:MAG TPA: AAA family ATPase [Kofleriaceae bacterium]